MRLHVSDAYTLFPKKRPPFYFSNNCQKLTDFNDFWCVKPWEELTSIACTLGHLTCILWPLYLGKSRKVIFQQYYSYIQIIYVISEENKLLPLYPPHLKNVTPLPCKMHNIFIWLKVCAFLQTLVDLKWAGCWLALVALKRTGCDVWQMECQASNITANAQSDHLMHGYILPVFFATD